MYMYMYMYMYVSASQNTVTNSLSALSIASPRKLLGGGYKKMIRLP